MNAHYICVYYPRNKLHTEANAQASFTSLSILLSIVMLSIGFAIRLLCCSSWCQYVYKSSCVFHRPRLMLYLLDSHLSSIMIIREMKRSLFYHTLYKNLRTSEPCALCFKLNIYSLELVHQDGSSRTE